MGRKADIGTPVVLLLFAVFAVLVMSVLIRCADVYGSAQERDAAALDAMVARQYMATKLWRVDGTPFAVLDGDWREADRGPALQWYEDYDGTMCKTILYLHDGHVVEDFTLAELDFQEGDGESILEAESLEFERTPNGVLVRMGLPGGQDVSFGIGFRSEVDGYAG